MIRDAILSQNCQHRYMLTRHWDNGPGVMFVMLNPSTADAASDDPTIRRCIRFAKDWGYPAMHVANLFSYRATDPEHLRGKSREELEGARHWAVLSAFLPLVATEVICAWGTAGTLHAQDRRMLSFLQLHGHDAYCLKTNADGTPAHPLYLPRNSQRQPL